MINELIHSHSPLFKLNRILPKVNCAISQCQSRLSMQADIWANHFANDLDAINSFTIRVNYGTI